MYILAACFQRTKIADPIQAITFQDARVSFMANEIPEAVKVGNPVWICLDKMRSLVTGVIEARLFLSPDSLNDPIEQNAIEPHRIVDLHENRHGCDTVIQK